MKFRKSTRYALYAALEMSRVGPDEQVTVNQVADRYAISTAVLAKIFQQLARAGIAVSTRGVGGGYSLAKKPSELTVLDVIEAFESPRSPEHCLLAEEGDRECTDRDLCRLRRLFDEVDEMVRCTYASVTLETLAGTRARPAPALRVV